MVLYFWANTERNTCALGEHFRLHFVACNIFTDVSLGLVLDNVDVKPMSEGLPSAFSSNASVITPPVLNRMLPKYGHKGTLTIPFEHPVAGWLKVCMARFMSMRSNACKRQRSDGTVSMRVILRCVSRASNDHKSDFYEQGLCQPYVGVFCVNMERHIIFTVYTSTSVGMFIIWSREDFT